MPRAREKVPEGMVHTGRVELAAGGFGCSRGRRARAGHLLHEPQTRELCVDLLDI